MAQIASDVQAVAGTEDVAVLARGEHLCMVMRGIRMGGLMTTSVMRGSFLQEATTRAEFLRIAGVG